jgi:predicted DNA-binding transcriptional regulator AlpA
MVMSKQCLRIGLREGTAVIWPKGLEAMLGISAPTRWRWEKDGKLPRRDVHIGGRDGWKPETIEKALSGQLVQPEAPANRDDLGMSAGARAASLRW